MSAKAEIRGRYVSILFIKKGVSKMLSNIGVLGLILILVLALIVFGPKKLPEVGRAFRQTLREFKKSTRELTEDKKLQKNFLLVLKPWKHIKHELLKK